MKATPIPTYRAELIRHIDELRERCVKGEVSSLYYQVITNKDRAMFGSITAEGVNEVTILIALEYQRDRLKRNIYKKWAERDEDDEWTNPG